SSDWKSGVLPLNYTRKPLDYNEPLSRVPPITISPKGFALSTNQLCRLHYYRPGNEFLVQSRIHRSPHGNRTRTPQRRSEDQSRFDLVCCLMLEKKRHI